MRVSQTRGGLGRFLAWKEVVAPDSTRDTRALSIDTLPRLPTLLLTLAIAGIFPSASAQELSRPPAVKSTPTQNVSPGDKPTGQGSIVTFKDGKLSVNTRSLPLESLADEITQKAGVGVILAEGLSKQPVTLNFESLPLDEALHRILKDHDAFFFYGVKKEGSATLSAVWVYPKGRARGFAPVPPEKWASTSELEKMVSDPDPETRSRAILGLIERKGNKAQDVALEGLRDRDDQVRYRTLDKAANAGIGLPADLLEKLVQSDSSEVVRFLALNAVAEGSGADSQNVRATAELALNDSSESVRNQAREILDHLEAASPPPDAGGSSKTQDEQGQGSPEPPME